MRVLITGGSGYLGRELVRQYADAGTDIVATYSTRPPDDDRADWQQLDVRERHATSHLVGKIRPDVVLHTAYRQNDWHTTADGAAHVATAATETGARLVHVSSDAVFSGHSPTYDETAAPDPYTPYGAAKAAAELAVTTINPGAIVARTSLILGSDGGSHQECLVHRLAHGEPGALFTDDIRCAVHVTDLATALRELAESTESGVFHLVGAEPVSRHRLGVLIAERDGLDPAALPTGSRAAAGIPGPLDVRLTSTRFRPLRGASDFLRTP